MEILQVTQNRCRSHGGKLDFSQSWIIPLQLHLTPSLVQLGLAHPHAVIQVTSLQFITDQLP
jgi:hypothetical protein